VIFPSKNETNVVNAARLAEFAKAAYYQSGSPELRALESETDMSLARWSNGNASGIIAFQGKTLVIAISGTDSADDIKNDADVLSQDVQGWSNAVGIPVIKTTGVQSSAGFLAYAALAGAELGSWIPADLSEWDVYLTGHSLGGAAALILQLTTKLQSASCFTFGCPKVFRGDVPERIRVSVRRAADPVVHVPPTYDHPSASVLWVRYAGSVRSKLPAWLKPVAWVASLYAVASLAAKAIGLPFRPTKAHAIDKYAADLEPLA
jgi:hypothetical protein